MADKDRSLGRLNTGAMFSRSANLAGKLDSNTQKEPEPAQPPAPPSKAKKPKRATPTRTGQPDRQRTPAPATRAGVAKSSNRSVYLDIAVRNALREQTHRTGQTLTEVILLSVEEAYDKLDDLLDQPATRAASTSLFEHAPVRRRKPGERMHVTLRLTPRNEEILDEITARYRVARSELIETALRHTLELD